MSVVVPAIVASAGSIAGVGANPSLMLLGAAAFGFKATIATVLVGGGFLGVGAALALGVFVGVGFHRAK